ncbi:uncharacterized protein MONBRDRAFT_35520 [Monosiga brevicollis MX1]|uniref:Uncharacterized protein n=1 Tax=Monosiga brevicollis TaxID=81824 RepID=A9UPN6_MONBE|nr:uncharacterized protein MONBRDRAFT_35520 [Monosiga brevicollis MX1]EDQ92454.1 predicted protein [Monosiga brevicollis MX1]|eukprot:XP_001742216.1 hypothetical protein [Monosiga brevicollis MX1]
MSAEEELQAEVEELQRQLEKQRALARQHQDELERACLQLEQTAESQRQHILVLEKRMRDLDRLQEEQNDSDQRQAGTISKQNLEIRKLHFQQRRQSPSPRGSFTKLGADTSPEQQKRVTISSATSAAAVQARQKAKAAYLSKQQELRDRQDNVARFEDMMALASRRKAELSQEQERTAQAAEAQARAFQEEISRLRDLLDEERELRRSLEHATGFQNEVSSADMGGSGSLADELALAALDPTANLDKSPSEPAESSEPDQLTGERVTLGVPLSLASETSAWLLLIICPGAWLDEFSQLAALEAEKGNEPLDNAEHNGVAEGECQSLDIDTEEQELSELAQQAEELAELRADLEEACEARDMLWSQTVKLKEERQATLRQTDAANRELAKALSELNDTKLERDSLQRRLLRRGKRLVELQQLAIARGFHAEAEAVIRHADAVSRQFAPAEMAMRQRTNTMQRLEGRRQSQSLPQGSDPSPLAAARAAARAAASGQTHAAASHSAPASPSTMQSGLNLAGPGARVRGATLSGAASTRAPAARRASSSSRMWMPVQPALIEDEAPAAAGMRPTRSATVSLFGNRRLRRASDAGSLAPPSKPPLPPRQLLDEA